MLGSGLATQLPLRRMQHRCAENPTHAAALAAWIVDCKLRSYHLPLARLRQALNEEGNHRCDAFAGIVEGSRKALSSTEEVAAVMGQEGYVARAWFTLLAESLPATWQFSGRNRRPPRDPVNALLSLGYTLLHGEARQIAIASGLDPSLGFLHQDYPGREALVLDICEPFRAGVDTLTIDLIFREAFHPQDFYYREQEGCRLSKMARPLFYQYWAECRENWPRAESDTPVSLPQSLRGFIQQFRAVMTEREVRHG
jgi:CRISPR-associated protein Cas1